MIKYINSKEMERASDVKRKYPNCKILMTHLDLSNKDDPKGRVYIVSTKGDSLELLCNEQYELQERDILAVIVGSYGSK